MKTNKQFTIDVEIAERLKQTNASQLINTLLKEYFECRSDKNTLLDEKTAQLDQISKKKKLLQKIYASLRSSMHLILIIFQRIGLDLVVKRLQKKRSKLILQGERAPFLSEIFKKDGSS